MQFEKNLQSARLIRRYNRFIVDVELEGKEQMTVYCSNTGSMKNCLYPGERVWYLFSEKKKRKYPCTLELAEIPVMFGNEERTTLVGLNTGRANKLVEEALQQKRVTLLSQYDSFCKEVRYETENSRVDFLLRQSGMPDCYLEVKNITLAVGDGLWLFPDSVTSRGTKHLRELTNIVKNGDRAVLFFFIQHTGIELVTPADDIDPVYGQALRYACRAGVEVIAMGTYISVKKFFLSHVN